MSRRIQLPNSENILAEAGAPGRLPLRRLYDATASQVYARALRITGDTADAESVTLHAYRRLCHEPSFCYRRGSFPMPWLMAVTRDIALNRCRKRRDCNPALPEASAIGYALFGIEDSLLKSILLKLEPGQARVLGLACYDDLTVSEIATCTGVPVLTVRASLCGALTAVKTRLASLDACRHRGATGR